MDTLDEDRYREIVDWHSPILYYVDDILVIVLGRLKYSEDCAYFRHWCSSISSAGNSFYREGGSVRSYLSWTLILRGDDGLRFCVYKKQTVKMSSYVTSPTTIKVKSGAVIASFIRAVMISSPEFLKDDVHYMIHSFMKYQYHKGFLLNQWR